MTQAVAPALEVLLTSMVDYAGLFPPAGLSMVDAVEEYLRHRRSDESWMLGRFVVPASRLDELGAVAMRPEHAGRGPWQLSVLLSAEPEQELERLERFLTRWDGEVLCTSLEVAPVAATRVAELVPRLPEGAAVYVEVPVGDDGEMLRAVAGAGARAKIRTGGVVADAIPTSGTVAAFLRRCHELELPFKATAGLHHALRSKHALTYDPGSPRAVMHGFLNLGLAAALVHTHDLPAATAAEVLEAGADELSFDDEGVCWRAHRLVRSELRRSRELFQSFGSCSFTEPVHDLKELALL